MAEFVVPAFLSDSSTDEVHARMLANVPDRFDKTQGNFVWDITRTPALELAEAVEFVLLEVIKSMFPMWAVEKMLDYHGDNRGLVRRAAYKASGIVTFYGTPGYLIPAGTLLSTTSEEDEDTILFVTVEDGEITEDGVNVAVEAVEAGASGNVAAGRINRMDTTDENVLSLTNVVATSGGLDMESDESYRERQTEYDRTQGESFIGSLADYRRWALSVPGVGGASVVPAEDDSGTIRITITDVDGNPASDELCTDVYNYIMRPDNPYERLAAINAVIVVGSVVTLDIDISVEVETDGIRSIDSIKADFIDALKEYYLIAVENKEIRYSKVASILSETAGVYDYSNLLINGGKENIPVELGYIPYSDDAYVNMTSANA